MKKVLIVASSFSHIRSFHLPYVREFRRLGWLTHVAAGGDPCREVREAADLALSLTLEKSYFSPQNLRACTELRRLIKKQNYSLIITHTTLGAAIARLAVKGLARRPRTVIVVHGYLFGPGAGLFPSVFLRAAEYFTAKETDRIITMNEWDRNWAEKNFPKKERWSIPGMGVDIKGPGCCGMSEKPPCFQPEKNLQGTFTTPEDGSSLFGEVSFKAQISPPDGMPPQNGSLPKKSGISKKHFTLVYPAEFSARKNQAFLIRAMRRLPLRVRLILPGDGALLSECRELAARLGLADRVIFPGYVDRIGTVLSEADAVVSSSRSEGLPFCIMEAMLCGLPVIASDVKGNRDLVENGETGFIFIPENARSFTKAVLILMKNRKKAARMGQAAFQRAQRFRLEKVLPEVMRAYTDDIASFDRFQHCAKDSNKPLISILLALYEPRMDWLRQQLDSLNAQTYPNIRLYIRDDCSQTVSFSEIEKLTASCITAFPYSLSRNDQNTGSNKNFELLTQEAEGAYFAYCDQDDIWFPEKLAVLQSCLEREGAELVCSDMYIINDRGKRIADSMTMIRRHHVFHSGKGLAKKLLVSNWVAGCTMLIRSESAKASLPFCPHMVHDQYLALWSARRGKIISLPDRLISYRIHEDNQTLAMAGVKDKESYLQIRIGELILRMKWLKRRFSEDSELSAEISAALRWARARKDYFLGDRSAGKTILHYRRFSPLTSIFELTMAGSPEKLFMWIIWLKKRNLV